MKSQGRHRCNVGNNESSDTSQPPAKRRPSSHEPNEVCMAHIAPHVQRSAFSSHDQIERRNPRVTAIVSKDHALSESEIFYRQPGVDMHPSARARRFGTNYRHTSFWLPSWTLTCPDSDIQGVAASVSEIHRMRRPGATRNQDQRNGDNPNGTGHDDYLPGFPNA